MSITRIENSRYDKQIEITTKGVVPEDIITYLNLDRSHFTRGGAIKRDSLETIVEYFAERVMEDILARIPRPAPPQMLRIPLPPGGLQQANDWLDEVYTRAAQARVRTGTQHHPLLGEVATAEGIRGLEAAGVVIDEAATINEQVELIQEEGYDEREEDPVNPFDEP